MIRCLAAVLIFLACPGCAVVTVAGAVVGVAVDVTVGATKAVAAGVSAVIP